MRTLTPLQRLGISHLLVNFRFHGNQWFQSGTITFQYNEKARTYEMWVKSNQREIVIHFSLRECENIDVSCKYYCNYKPEDIMFTIEDDNERVVES